MLQTKIVTTFMSKVVQVTSQGVRFHFVIRTFHSIKRSVPGIRNVFVIAIVWQTHLTGKNFENIFQNFSQLKFNQINVLIFR